MAEPVTHELWLDLKKETQLVPDAIEVRVGEGGTQVFKAHLEMDGAPYRVDEGWSATLRLLTGANVPKTQEAEIGGDGRDELTITLADEMLTDEGTCKLAYFALVGPDSETLTTEGFKLRILGSTMKEATGQSWDSRMERLIKEFEVEVAHIKAKEAERVANEEIRIENEKLRQKQEDRREKQERQRETAERKREQASQTAVKNAEAATESANTAASTATTAAQHADEATEASKAQTQAAKDATTATEAATKASQDQTALAKEATDAANAATQASKDQTALAKDATDRANTAAETAETGEEARVKAEGERVAAETARAGAEEGRVSAEEARETAEGKRKEADTGRESRQTANDEAQDANDAAQAANDLAQQKNNAQQEANNQAAYNHQFVTLVEGQYDPDTRKPTIEEPASGPVYRVPKEAPSETNKYDEWYWAVTTDGAGEWEAWTATQIAEAPAIPTDKIDRIVSGEEVGGDEVTKTSSLSYYDKAVKQRTETAISDAVSAQAATQTETDTAQDTAIKAAKAAADKANTDLETHKTAQGKTDAAQDEEIKAAKQRAEEAYNHIPDLVSKTAAGIVPAFPESDGPFYIVALDGELKGWQVIPVFAEGVAGLVPAAPSPDEGEKALLTTGWGDYKGGGLPDYRALKAAIAAAEKAKADTKVAGSGDYEFGTPVASQQALSSLEAAIATAQGVLDKYEDPSTTQDILDAAATAMNGAVETFEESVSPLQPDKAGLTAQETRYTQLKGSVVTSTDGKDVPFGDMWVTTSEQQAADTALQAARTAVAAAKKQSEIASAVSTLDSALDTYESARKTATKDTAALDRAIEAANTAKADVLTSDSDGSDLPAGSRYVTTAQMKALTDALSAAQGAKTSASTQKALDDATSILTAATATFSSQVKQNVSIYGVRFTGFPGTTKGTRTDASESFGDPSPAINGQGGSSPFDSCFPWSEMQVVDRDGGKMVRIPRFWVKYGESGANGVDTYQIATGPMDGFEVAPAFADRHDGKGEREEIFVGAYHCATGTYKSTSGVRPQVSTTRAAMRTNVKSAIGDTYHLMDLTTQQTIDVLYLVEFADYNSQKCIGYGCGNNSSVENNGASDAIEYHTGTVKSTRETYGVGIKYRGIENPWANVYTVIDGCYNNGSGLNLILNPDEFSENSNGQLVGMPTAGWTSKLSAKKVDGVTILYPTAASGSESTGTCDSWSFSGSDPVLIVGGNYSQGQVRGLFCVGYNGSGSGSTCGFRLLELP